MQVSYSCLVPNQTKKKDKKIQFFSKRLPDRPMTRKFPKYKKQGCECILLQSRLQNLN